MLDGQTISVIDRRMDNSTDSKKSTWSFWMSFSMGLAGAILGNVAWCVFFRS